MTATVAGGGSIWLVRHAPSAWTGVRWCGRSDPGLTPAGRAAASRLAGDLARDVAAVLVAEAAARPAEAVVLSSPLRRSVETAEAIGRALRAPVRIDPDLVEIDFGVADGLTWDELLAAHPTLAATILLGDEPDWPRGETHADVDRRAGRAAGRIHALSSGAPVVVVSHGGVLRAIARHLDRRPVAGDVGAAPVIRLEPASMLRLDPFEEAVFDATPAIRP